MIAKIKEFFKKNEADIIMVIGVILISIVSFGFGWVLAKNYYFNNYITKNDNKNEIKIEEPEASFESSNENAPNNLENLKASIDRKNIKETMPQNNFTENNKISAGKGEYNNNYSQNPSLSANCKYVGSKNSNVYHLPDCPGAKRIKEENKRCFSSKEEAEKAGYRPAKNCSWSSIK